VADPLPAVLGLVPRLQLLHGPHDLNRRRDEADLPAQVVDPGAKRGRLRRPYATGGGGLLAQVMQKGEDVRQRQAVAVEVVVVDRAPATGAGAAAAALEVRVVEALEDAREEELGGTAAFRGCFLGVFEEDAQLEAGAKVPEGLEGGGGGIGGVRGLRSDVVSCFYGSGEEIDAVDCLDEEVAYLSALLRPVSIP